VTTPEKVEKLHAFRDGSAALEYLLEEGHYDKREPVRPMHITVPDGWDDTAIAAAGTPMPPLAWCEGKMQTRYTLTDWRKRQVVMTMLEMQGITAVQKYYETNYDLKEVLDKDDNLVSSERGKEYVAQSPVVIISKF
jgi:hypothetical protein